MKKVITFILTAMMITGLVSCSKDKEKSSSTKDNTSSSVSESSSEAEASLAESPLEVLNTVWATYEEAEKFPIAGGDFSEENNNMEGPGKFSIEDAEAIDSQLGFPVASIAKIEDAASIVHMMNANTFTCGTYRVKKGEDIKAVADEIKANIIARQWMCGIPEKYAILTAGEDVICVFGAVNIVDVFTAKVKTSYPTTETVSEDNIA